MANFFRANLF